MLMYHKILETATPPMRQSEKSVGYDLASALDYVLPPHTYTRIRTGLSLTPPDGYWLMVTLRSSMGKQVMLANGVGIIDPDYCGPEDEIQIALRNVSAEDVIIQQGQRIAQAILLPVAVPAVMPSRSTFANRGGFGSTGCV